MRDRRLSAAAEILGTQFPDSRMQALLKACLFSGEAARDAWQDAASAITDLIPALRQDLQVARTLVPLLAAAQRRSGGSAPSDAQTLLRTAWLREELRSRVFDGIVTEVATALDEASVPFVLLGGAAVGATVYVGVGLRHTHGIELLVRPTDRQRAATSLVRAGFIRSADPGRDPRRRASYTHKAGVPVTLWQTALGELGRSEPNDAVFGRCCVSRVGDRSFRVLSPEDAILHACASALDTAYPDGLLCYADMWLIAQRHAGMNWDSVIETARDERIGLVAWRVFAFLATALHAGIPSAVLVRLETAALDTDEETYDQVLYWSRERVGIARIIRVVADWGGRASLITRLLFPSRAYMLRLFPNTPRLLLPSRYVLRMIEFAVERLRNLLFGGDRVPPGAPQATQPRSSPSSQRYPVRPLEGGGGIR